MKHSIFIHFGSLLVGLLFTSVASAQTGPREPSVEVLPEFVYPLGDLVFANDTSMFLTANGGLYGLHPACWQIAPDTSNLLISYLTMSGRQDALFTVYQKNIEKTCLYWRYDKDSETHIDRLTTLPGFYKVLQKDKALFLVGRKDAVFHIYEYVADTLSDLYSSRQYIPSDVHLLNGDMLLLSVGNRIVSLHRTEGLKELFHLDTPVLSFSIGPEQQLFVVTEKGLCEYESGGLNLIGPELTGRLFVEKDRMYLLNGAGRKVYCYRL